MSILKNVPLRNLNNLTKNEYKFFEWLMGKALSIVHKSEKTTKRKKEKTKKKRKESNDEKKKRKEKT